MREFNLCDRIISQIDTAISCLFVPENRVSIRPSPALSGADSALSPQEKLDVIGLMRVNHTGEVCAQALYQAQSLTAKSPATQESMHEAAQEEVDHLAWCELRLRELNARPSYLNFLWYSGSFLIGSLAGIAGVRWSLGFVAETERQVNEHLKVHIGKIPAHDKKTQLILAQMASDEMRHAKHAESFGGNPLPLILQISMRYMSKCMTSMSYYI